MAKQKQNDPRFSDPNVTDEQPEKEKPSIEDRLNTIEAALAYNQIFTPDNHPGAESAASHADRNAPQPKRR